MIHNSRDFKFSIFILLLIMYNGTTQFALSVLTFSPQEKFDRVHFFGKINFPSNDFFLPYLNATLEEDIAVTARDRI